MRHRITLVALCVLALLAAACSSAPDLDGPDTPVPLSYMIRGSQENAARVIAECWGEAVHFPAGEVDRSHWLKTNQEFQFRGHEGQAFRLSTTFKHAGFDPALSTWRYGDTRILNDEIAPVAGHSFLFDNRHHNEPLEVDTSESVTYGQTRSTRTDHEVTDDLSVSSKTGVTIGGEAEGAKLEEEVTVTLGITDKQETEKAQGESTDRTDTQAVKTDVVPYGATLAVIKSPNVTSLTPFAINGIWESPLTLGFNSAAFNSSDAIRELSESKRATSSTYHGPSYGIPTVTWSIEFTSWDDWLEAITGVNTDFPHSNTQLCPAHIATLNNPETRRLQWSGTQHRTYQESAEYSYSDVTDGDVDGIIERYGIDSGHVITGG